MNCYEILGVNKDASQSDIKKAYRKLVKQHHPDTGGSEERFKEISVAYETLSDPQKRQEYDLKSSFNGGGRFDQFYNQLHRPLLKLLIIHKALLHQYLILKLGIVHVCYHMV